MTPHSAHDWGALRRAARHDNRLTMTARVLFEDVCDLAAKDGVCRKRPESFAITYDCSLTRITDALKVLAELGYVERRRLPSDGRRKGFTPTWPARANPEVKEDAPGKPGRLSESDAETDPEIRVQLHADFRTAPGVYTPPEGGSGARTHEGPGPEPRPTGAPTLGEVLARAGMAGVPDEVATRFFWHYEAVGWTTGGEHPRPIGNWPAQLMRWNLDEPRFERKGGAGGAPADASAANAFLEKHGVR